MIALCPCAFRKLAMEISPNGMDGMRRYTGIFGLMSMIFKYKSPFFIITKAPFVVNANTAKKKDRSGKTQYRQIEEPQHPEPCSAMVPQKP